jgi:hypothetical protein
MNIALKAALSLILLLVIVSLLSGCGADQQLKFTPVAKLNQESYGNGKKFYRSGVLEKLDQPTGYFWQWKKKM